MADNNCGEINQKSFPIEPAAARPIMEGFPAGHGADRPIIVQPSTSQTSQGGAQAAPTQANGGNSVGSGSNGGSDGQR
jgi:hypothetical protein